MTSEPWASASRTMIRYDSTVLSSQVTVIPQHHVDFRPQSLRHKRIGQPQADPGFIDKTLSLCQVSGCHDLSPSSLSGRMMGRSYLKESPRKLRAFLFPPHTALQPLTGSPVFGVSVHYGVSIVIYKAFQNTSTCQDSDSSIENKAVKSQRLCWEEAALASLLPTLHQ